MRMLFRHMAMALWLLAAMLPAACSDDDSAPLEYRADIVTFTGNDDSGATFGRIEQNSDDVTPLVARGVRVDTAKVLAGSRVLMVYEEMAELSGPMYVNVRSLQQIVNGAVSVADETDGWDKDAIYMMSLWRTGNYLNLECRVENSEEPRNFGLIADPATLDNAVPDLYVAHDMGDHPASYMRRIYASWDISAVWSRAGCRGVRVHMRDSNRNIKEMTFTKE